MKGHSQDRVFSLRNIPVDDPEGISIGRVHRPDASVILVLLKESSRGKCLRGLHRERHKIIPKLVMLHAIVVCELHDKVVVLWSEKETR